MKHQVMLLPSGKEIILIHFVTHDEFGQERIACLPNLEQFSVAHDRLIPVHRSLEARAVTCPLCKDTPLWKEADEAMTLLRLRRKLR